MFSLLTRRSVFVTVCGRSQQEQLGTDGRIRFKLGGTDCLWVDTLSTSVGRIKLNGTFGLSHRKLN